MFCHASHIISSSKKGWYRLISDKKYGVKPFTMKYNICCRWLNALFNNNMTDACNDKLYF